MNTKELTNILNEQLKPKNFKKKGNLWYFESEECYSLIELDKSKYGGQFSLMLDVIVKKIHYSKTISTNYGSIGGWSVDWLCADREKFNRILDLENNINLDIRRSEIIKVLSDKVIPFLKRINTIQGLKQELKDNKRLRYHISSNVWYFLDLDIDKEPKLANFKEDKKIDNLNIKRTIQ